MITCHKYTLRVGARRQALTPDQNMLRIEPQPRDESKVPKAIGEGGVRGTFIPEEC